MKFLVPTSFIRYYLGTFTAMWIVKHGIPADEGFFNEFKGFIQMELESARRRSDLVILEILAAHLAQNPEIDLRIYNESEVEWTQKEMNLIIDLILANSLRVEAFSNLQSKIGILEMPLQEWRTNTKPEILKMLAAEGIEP